MEQAVPPANAPMKALKKLFHPLRQAAAAFFKHDLAIKREPEGLQLVLQARPRAPLSKKASRADATARREKAEQALVLEQLGALLSECPRSRSALRHLVFVEGAIAKKGLRVLHKLPLEVLERGLEQLEGLVTNWSPEGLANLRSKMAVALLDREHASPTAAEEDAYRTAAVLEHTPAARADGEQGQGSDNADEGPQTLSDDEALAAAYAALGNAAPVGEVEIQGELGSRSARALAPPPPRASESAGKIELRELQH
jgi:hypothetical protein